jgi:hypothetical protein
VLATPDTEQRFLEFVQGAGRARQRWEHAELECQRLAIELARSSQEVGARPPAARTVPQVSLLEARLAQARGMLEAEGQARRRAEQARDLLAEKFAAVQRLVLAEGPGHALHQRVSTLLGAPDPLFDPVILPDLPAGDRTEDSVYNVSQLSFDDTMDLCQDSPLQRCPLAACRFLTRVAQVPIRRRPQEEEPQRGAAPGAAPRPPAGGGAGGGAATGASGQQAAEEEQERGPRGGRGSRRQDQEPQPAGARRRPRQPRRTPDGPEDRPEE